MELAKQIDYDGYVILRDMYGTIYGYLHIFTIALIAVSYALLNMDGSSFNSRVSPETTGSFRKGFRGVRNNEIPEISENVNFPPMANPTTKCLGIVLHICTFRY